jgi:hypothetical protein
MNNVNHVILEEIFTSVNLLPKYLKGKIKASKSVVSA